MDTKLSRQEQEVLDILKGCGSRGMNSYQWRTRFIQLPARIFGLKSKGHRITTRQRKNGSVDYLLIESSAVVSQHAQVSQDAPPPKRWTFDAEGNASLVPEDQEPKQETLL